MAFVGDLRQLLGGRRFRQLFAVRVVSQGADGVFQVALASYLLFSPERQPDAAAIAGALAAVLLPFSVLGPFVGVFLDRWNRRQILVLANLLRTLPVLAAAAVIALDASTLLLFVLVIMALGVNRFLLAGLSAALPRVVPATELVLANAVTPTSGTVAFLGGLAAGTVWLRLPGGVGSDPVVIVVAAAVYVAAAGLALLIPRDLLGPDRDSDLVGVRDELRAVLVGLGAGLRHLGERRRAGIALAAVAAHRFNFGLATVMTILLYRNYFNDSADTDAGLAGLSTAVLVSGAGFFAAALVTPAVTARISINTWIVVLLSGAAVSQAFPASLFTEPALLLSAFVLGVSAQGVKICADTLVQTHTDDEFRGRVFSLYDVMFNVVFVLAAALGAVVIPVDGKSYAVLAGIVVGYAAAAVAYGRAAAAIGPGPEGRPLLDGSVGTL